MAGGGCGASSSSSLSYAWKHDVFLSFRGSDTRYGFTGNLYNALVRRGIHTFLDDKDLQRGEEISQALVKEIQHSRIAIPIFSKNYASSSFCLDELSTITECVKAKGRLVLPIFYDVDPSDVRHHKGSYGEALARHEQRFKDNKEKVLKWKMALHQAANLSGEHFRLGNEYEYVFIEKIVEVVSKKINRKPLHVADYPVGLESQMLRLRWLLDTRYDNEVHMVGIYGIGGIGKTTLARALYNLIADQFEGLCFLENVRENSTRHGLVHLQKILLFEIFGEDIKLENENQGIPIIKHRLGGKKVLLILDDVDKNNQLRVLIGGLDWFGSGSRIIITTRDKHLLTSHGIERTYMVYGLNKKEALELFCWNAFKNKQVDPDYVSIINRAVTYACGLPLALEVIGSNLCGKSIEEWRSALDQYEKIPNKEIQKILQVSFDGLEEQEQQNFLDIACCFKGFKSTEVEYILCAHYGGCQKYVIRVLIEKSLIKINHFGQVTLHDLIRDMGREIVRQQGNPGKRSRLWYHEDIIEVLEENAGTSEIQIIFLDLPESKEEVIEWDGEAFKNMTSMKTLIIRNACFSQGAKYLPNSLRVLEWQRYPSHSLPYHFHPKKLVILKLGSSCSTSLFPELQKKFLNLRVLDLSYNKYIRQIADVSGIPNLEELSFRGCENLTKIDESVGFLERLKMLDAGGCTKLKSFPPIKLICLEELQLSFCKSLENFPEILAKMEKIRWIALEYTAIKELPVSIQNLTQLEHLNLNVSGMLQSPSSIAWLTKRHIRLDFESKQHNSIQVSLRNISDESLPIFLARFANVEELKLSDRTFTILPACITEFCFLRELYLVGCHYLQEIRGIPPNLETLYVKYCRSLKDLDLTEIHESTREHRFLRRLILEYCENVEEIRGIQPNIELLSAENCTSLAYTCRNKLLNQELHKEAGNMWLLMPGSQIPEWFEHRGKGSLASFWFRTMFPAISFCVVIDLPNDLPNSFEFCPKLKINGITVTIGPVDKKGYLYMPGIKADHIFIFNQKQIKFEDNVDEVLLENEWNHAEFFIDIRAPPYRINVEFFVGFHVFKGRSGMEDIQLTDPDHFKTYKERFFSALRDDKEYPTRRYSILPYPNGACNISLV